MIASHLQHKHSYTPGRAPSVCFTLWVTRLLLWVSLFFSFSIPASFTCCSTMTSTPAFSGLPFSSSSDWPWSSIVCCESPRTCCVSCLCPAPGSSPCWRGSTQLSHDITVTPLQPAQIYGEKNRFSSSTARLTSVKPVIQKKSNIRYAWLRFSLVFIVVTGIKQRSCLRK